MLYILLKYSAVLSKAEIRVAYEHGCGRNDGFAGIFGYASARILIILFPGYYFSRDKKRIPEKYGVIKLVVMDTVGGITPPPQRA